MRVQLLPNWPAAGVEDLLSGDSLIVEGNSFEVEIEAWGVGVVYCTEG